MHGFSSPPLPCYAISEMRLPNAIVMFLDLASLSVGYKFLYWLFSLVIVTATQNGLQTSFLEPRGTERRGTRNVLHSTGSPRTREASPYLIPFTGNGAVLHPVHSSNLPLFWMQLNLKPCSYTSETKNCKLVVEFRGNVIKGGSPFILFSAAWNRWQILCPMGCLWSYIPRMIKESQF